MRASITQKAKHTAVLTSVLVCMFAPLFSEDHDWNTSLTEKPGGPHRFSNRTRNVKHIPVVYGLRSKRPREFIQTPYRFTRIVGASG